MSLLRRLRSFQRGTVGLCRSTGVKVTSCQSWRFEKNSANWPTSNHTSASQVWFLDDKIILQLWRFVTLQPVDLQRPTVPLWKDIDLVIKLFSAQGFGSILDVHFVLTKRSYLQRVYLVSKWSNNFLSECTWSLNSFIG